MNFIYGKGHMSSERTLVYDTCAHSSTYVHVLILCNRMSTGIYPVTFSNRNNYTKECEIIGGEYKR